MNSKFSWPSTSKAYQLEFPIGYGAFGTVYLAFVLQGPQMNSKVAIKVIDLDQFPDESIEEIRKEIKITRLCSHPNVVHYHIAFLSHKQIWMVMPLLEGGSLANLIRREYPNGIHDEVALSIILKEVLQALVYFHANNQIHRDVKAANILLSKDGKILLGDYGVCAKLREGLNAKTFAGSPCWMAPEVIESECLGGYNFKVDIWSFGITALELARGKPPYAQHTALKVMMLILENDPPILVREDRFDSSFKQMVNSCLKRDPKQRPSAEQLLHMKFFQKARGIEYIRTHLLHDLPPLNVLVPRSTLKIEEALFSTSSGGWDFTMSGEMTRGSKNNDPFAAIETDEYGEDPLDVIKSDDA